MGFQFVHIETYSRSGGRNNKLNIAEIISEARRSPEACQHVDNPKKPILVYGCDFDELIARHDMMIDQAKEMLSNGKKRALRKDTSSLFTCVISHPATPEECWENTEIKSEVEAWAKDTVKWLRNDLEMRGGTLDAVMMHTDEAHIHLHAYGLHNSGHADHLHPGKLAKKAAAKAACENGLDKKAANTIGDKAYVQAMREWQDSYSEKVGLSHGLTRLGPARRRLSRADWMREKAAAKSVQQAKKLANEVIVNTQNAIRDHAERKIAAEKAIVTAEENARNTIHEAKVAALKLMDEAQKEVKRVRSLGIWLRMLWDGLRISRIRKALSIDAERLVDIERNRTAELQRKLTKESLRCARMETKLNNSDETLALLIKERKKTKKIRNNIIHAKSEKESKWNPKYN